MDSSVTLTSLFDYYYQNVSIDVFETITSQSTYASFKLALWKFFCCVSDQQEFVAFCACIYDKWNKFENIENSLLILLLCYHHEEFYNSHSLVNLNLKVSQECNNRLECYADLWTYIKSQDNNKEDGLKVREYYELLNFSNYEEIINEPSFKVFRDQENYHILSFLEVPWMKLYTLMRDPHTYDSIMNFDNDSFKISCIKKSNDGKDYLVFTGYSHPLEQPCMEFMSYNIRYNVSSNVLKIVEKDLKENIMAIGYFMKDIPTGKSLYYLILSENVQDDIKEKFFLNIKKFHNQIQYKLNDLLYHNSILIQYNDYKSNKNKKMIDFYDFIEINRAKSARIAQYINQRQNIDYDRFYEPYKKLKNKIQANNEENDMKIENKDKITDTIEFNENQNVNQNENSNQTVEIILLPDTPIENLDVNLLMTKSFESAEYSQFVFKKYIKSLTPAVYNAFRIYIINSVSSMSYLNPNTRSSVLFHLVKYELSNNLFYYQNSLSYVFNVNIKYIMYERYSNELTKLMKILFDDANNCQYFYFIYFSIFNENEYLQNILLYPSISVLMVKLIDSNFSNLALSTNINFFNPLIMYTIDNIEKIYNNLITNRQIHSLIEKLYMIDSIQPLVDTIVVKVKLFLDNVKGIEILKVLLQKYEVYSKYVLLTYIENNIIQLASGQYSSQLVEFVLYNYYNRFKNKVNVLKSCVAENHNSRDAKYIRRTISKF